jgi:hypothetical protein
MNTTTATPTVKPEDFTRVNNDVNGNPRYVCHYTNLLTDADEKLCTGAQIFKTIDSIDRRYQTALNRAKKIGGRKFHNKQFGGGIVFQSYNIQATADRINELLTTGK